MHRISGLPAARAAPHRIADGHQKLLVFLSLRLDCELSRPVHRLHRFNAVNHEVHDDLLQLHAIPPDPGKILPDFDAHATFGRSNACAWSRENVLRESTLVGGVKIYVGKTTRENLGHCNFLRSHRMAWIRTAGEQLGRKHIQNELRLLPRPGRTLQPSGKELTCRGFSLGASSTAV